MENFYTSKIWPGIADACEKNNVNLFLFAGKSPKCPYGYDIQHNIVFDLVDKNNVDGIIILSATLNTFLNKNEQIRFFNKYSNLPVLSLGVKMEGVPSIIIDNENGITEAVNHLVRVHGHKRIAFIKGPDNHQEAYIRYQAYLKALKSHGLSLDPELVYSGNFVMETGEDAVYQLLKKRKKKLDAILAANDDMALGAYKALKELGFSVPKDVALIGFDDSDIAKAINPPLTTVRQPFCRLTREAVEMVIRIINGDKVHEIVSLPTTLVVRETCGCYSQLIINNMNKKNYSIKSGNDISCICESLYEELNKEFNFACEKDEVIYHWVMQLINKIYSNLDNDNYMNDLLQTISEIPIDEIEYIPDKMFFYKLLENIRRRFIAQYTEIEKINRMNNFIKNAQVVIGEMLLRKNAYISIKDKEMQWVLRGITQKLLTSFKIKELVDSIFEEIPRINIKTCFLLLYGKKPVKIDDFNWIIPGYSRVIQAYTNNKKINIDNENKFFKTEILVPQQFLDNSKVFKMVVVPLFFKEEHFGYIVFELGTNVASIYENLRGQISTSLKGTFLFRRQKEISKELKKTLSALEISNKRLQSLSLTDELTGLYNRRGLITLGEQQIKLAKRMNKTLLLFFIDIDGLKSINDNYGHDEGDDSIINTSNILKKNFRPSDIISRIGGDEFVVLTFSEKPENLIEITERLQKSIDVLNSSSKKKYRLSFSIGSSFLNFKSDLSMEDLMKQADKDLYKQKYLKKKS